jgi:GTP-binding protein
MSLAPGSFSVHGHNRRRAPVISRRFEARFVGSFFDPGQTPSDRRPQVAVAGRSNVGKSSLLNQVLGVKRLAKVSSTPGKTRSLNYFLIDEKFYFVDLPGYGFAKVSKKMRDSWGQLIESYLTRSADLIGLVLLLDCRREPTPEDMMLLEWLSQRELPALVVVTKTDKLSKSKVSQKVGQVETEMGVHAIPFSIKTGVGKRELVSAVLDLVKQHRNR